MRIFSILLLLFATASHAAENDCSTYISPGDELERVVTFYDDVIEYGSDELLEIYDKLPCDLGICYGNIDTNYIVLSVVQVNDRMLINSDTMPEGVYMEWKAACQ